MSRGAYLAHFDSGNDTVREMDMSDEIDDGLLDASATVRLAREQAAPMKYGSEQYYRWRQAVGDEAFRLIQVAWPNMADEWMVAVSQTQALCDAIESVAARGRSVYRPEGEEANDRYAVGKTICDTLISQFGTLADHRGLLVSALCEVLSEVVAARNPEGDGVGETNGQ